MSTSGTTFGSLDGPLGTRNAETARGGALSSTAVRGAVLLGALAFFNEANFRVADIESFSFDMQVALRLALCGIAGVYGFMHLPATAKWLFKTPGLWMFLFAAWCLLTSVVAVNPMHAIAASVMLCCVVLFAPAVLDEIGPRRVLEILLLSLGAYLAGSWFMYLFVPSIGYDQYILEGFEDHIRLGGLGHPNSTGRIAALALILLFVFRARYRWSWRVLCLPLLGVCISLWWAGSRTAMVAGVFAILVATRRTSGPLAVLCLTALAVIAPLAWLALGGDVHALMVDVSRTGEISEIYELNGRVPLWYWISDRIADAPVFGYGFACPRFVLIDYGESWAAAHAHNLFLQVALSTGVLGLLFFGATALSLLGGLLKRVSEFPDAILALTMVSGIADVSLFSPVPDSFTLCWIFALFWREPEVVARDAPQATGETAA